MLEIQTIYEITLSSVYKYCRLFDTFVVILKLGFTSSGNELLHAFKVLTYLT